MITGDNKQAQVLADELDALTGQLLELAHVIEHPMISTGDVRRVAAKMIHALVEESITRTAVALAAAQEDEASGPRVAPEVIAAYPLAR